MNRLAHTKMNQRRRQIRVRSRAGGTPQRPRLSVHLSNRQVVAQIIDDSNGQSLAFATSVGIKALDKKSMTEKAIYVGEQIAAAAKKAKVEKVVFDRGARLYHGRVKALADSAREKGLKF